jgi:hypothetical protein
VLRELPYLFTAVGINTFVGHDFLGRLARLPEVSMGRKRSTKRQYLSFDVVLTFFRLLST